MTETLYRIRAPHYVAGVVVRDGVVCDAPPILGWARYKRFAEVEAYFRRKKYEIKEIRS